MFLRCGNYPIELARVHLRRVHLRVDELRHCMYVAKRHQVLRTFPNRQGYGYRHQPPQNFLSTNYLSKSSFYPRPIELKADFVLEASATFSWPSIPRIPASSTQQWLPDSSIFGSSDPDYHKLSFQASVLISAAPVGLGTYFRAPLEYFWVFALVDQTVVDFLLTSAKRNNPELRVIAWQPGPVIIVDSLGEWD
jgi:hypothetical protein